MQVGEYISVSSQRDAERADIEQERLEQLKGPAAQVSCTHTCQHSALPSYLPFKNTAQVHTCSWF